MNKVRNHLDYGNDDRYVINIFGGGNGTVYSDRSPMEALMFQVNNDFVSVLWDHDKSEITGYDMIYHDDENNEDVIREIHIQDMVSDNDFSITADSLGVPNLHNTDLSQVKWEGN
jgi:hypothetical protein